MTLILYTTHCPKCNILSVKLKEKHLKYQEITDIDVMQEKGFTHIPMLEVDGQIMNYAEAFKWITEGIEI